MSKEQAWYKFSAEKAPPFYSSLTEMGKVARSVLDRQQGFDTFFLTEMTQCEQEAWDILRTCPSRLPPETISYLTTVIKGARVAQRMLDQLGHSGQVTPDGLNLKSQWLSELADLSEHPPTNIPNDLINFITSNRFSLKKIPEFLHPWYQGVLGVGINLRPIPKDFLDEQYDPLFTRDEWFELYFAQLPDEELDSNIVTVLAQNMEIGKWAFELHTGEKPTVNKETLEAFIQRKAAISLVLQTADQVIPKAETKYLNQLMEAINYAEQVVAGSKDTSINASVLTMLIAQGQQSRQTLIDANTKLVISTVGRYEYFLPINSLASLANVHLIYAVDRFDWSMGYKFSTYATSVINGKIKRDLSKRFHQGAHNYDAIKEHRERIRMVTAAIGQTPTLEQLTFAYLINLYVDVKYDWITWEKIISQIKPGDGGEPTFEYVALQIMQEYSRKNHAPKDWIRKIRVGRTMVRKHNDLAGIHLVSLERLTTSEEDGSIVPIRELAEESTIEEDAARVIMAETIEELLGTLNPRERTVMKMRMGLGSFDRAHTLEEVAQAFGLTKNGRERIRQIEAKALRKLRHPLKASKLRDYLG